MLCYYSEINNSYVDYKNTSSFCYINILSACLRCLCPGKVDISSERLQNQVCLPRGFGLAPELDNKCQPARFLRIRPADISYPESRKLNCTHRSAKALFPLTHIRYWIPISVWDTSNCSPWAKQKSIHSFPML